MAIDQLQQLDRTATSFRTDVDALFTGQLNNVIEQMNALGGGMSAMAAGGAYAFQYTFDSATADADPGTGKLRLSSGTQNAATTLRIDVLTSGGASIASVFDALQAVTSSIKGAVRMVKSTDPMQWLLFDIAAVGSGVGYRNITLAHRGGSSASPFVNGDPLMLYIDRNGDSGTVPGATEMLGELIVPSTAPVAMFGFPNVFTANHDWYSIDVNLQSNVGVGLLYARGAVGGVYDTNASGYWSTAATGIDSQFRMTSGSGSTAAGGVLQIGDVSGALGKPFLFDGFAGDGATNAGFSSRGRKVGTAALSGFNIYSSTGGSNLYGIVRVYGRRKA